MTDLGSLSFFLCVVVSQTDNGVFLSLTSFSKDKLSSVDMSCNSCSTPTDTKSKLSPDVPHVTNRTLSYSLVGVLQYLTFTRLDIAYIVMQICLFMDNLHEPQLLDLKLILRYIQGTLLHGLFLRPSSIDHLVYYTNVD